MKLSSSECELMGGWRGDMRGKVIQGWSMWSFIMASSGGDAVERKMKVTSWEMVVVVVIAIVGDGRDVVAIGTESGVIGSIYNYDTISIIAIISISINSIIIIMMIIIISSEDGRDSRWMSRSQWFKEIGARDAGVRKAWSSAEVNVITMTSVIIIIIIIIIMIIIMKANSARKKVVIRGRHARKEGRWKSGNERGGTIPCGWNDIDVRNVEIGYVLHCTVVDMIV